MLELNNITKDYPTGDTAVHALKGVSLQFRDSEFVAVLGQSGCGKTTLLNIIGGLDHYTTGDLIIDGTSTKKYTDRDWDAYRNHRVGFVFQSYNLIPHQTVLSNVELALTLSGVSRRERRQRATEALEAVGLGDQLDKKPNQMSGGQMQRVAIARALVNNPAIVLADEPTGALDSETSVQVMDILREVAKDRLVIMVTHNPELAQQYATRIVRLKDGVILSDSDPYEITEQDRIALEDSATGGMGRTSMSLGTAFSLSFNNLLTKKGRTLLTAFAGSIGIIGIALILSLSSGAQDYIKDTEEDTMGQYPITIQKESYDLTSLLTMGSGSSSDSSDSSDSSTSGDSGDGSSDAGTGSQTADEVADSGEVGTNNVVTSMVNQTAATTSTNDMESIKEWLDSNPDDLQSYVTDIQYTYRTPLNIYKSDTSSGVVQVNPQTVTDALGMTTEDSTQQTLMSSFSGSSGTRYDVWEELLDNADEVERSYSLVEGRMPSAWNEVVIVLDENGKISDFTLYALGLKDQSELEDMVKQALDGEEIPESGSSTYTLDELMSLTFKLVPESAYYQKNDDGTWTDMSDDEDYLKQIVDNADTIEVVGVVQATGNGSSSSSNIGQWGGVLYTKDLMTHLIDEVDSSEIVQQQKADASTDVFTGYPFSDGEDLTMDDIDQMIAEMPESQASQVQSYIDQMRSAGMSDDEIISAFQSQMSSETSNATYDDNLTKLGVADVDDPYSISIYPIDFDAKEQVDQIISDYNDRMEASGQDDKVISYTDVVGALMSSVTDIVNNITYILIAFVAISLVVSSIMIGIITYISVLERTKEIGILRSIGASKRDVSRVFNAETFVIGLAAGLIGIGLTLLLIIPVNAIIYSLAGVQNMAALPAGAAIVLVAISVVLTMIGGFIPSKMAAKADPVTALRSE
jgi:putative ABC transport system permease protein